MNRVPFLLLLFLVSCSGLSRGIAPSSQKTGVSTPSAVLPEPAIQITAAKEIPTQPAPSGASTSEVLPGITATALSSVLATLPQPSLTPASDLLPNSGDIPDPADVVWQPIAAGLVKPNGMESAPDGSGRLFILEQTGQIRVLREGLLEPVPFLDLSDRLTSVGFEQGLLGLAFHPEFGQNGFFYVNYTDLNGDTVIARFQLSTSDPNQADPGSELQLLRVDQPFANHNGGEVAFSPDGYLYLGLGDGGSAGDPQNNAQSLDSLLGKILRLDVNSGDPYGIPESNPFLQGGGRAEIFAYGLRNPWRFSFDLQTGDLYIGDVGQNAWEEINFLSAEQIQQVGDGGAYNFGWSYLEGNHPYNGDPPSGIETIPPIAEYGHEYGCSITGGVVYRGSILPNWQGVYLYGDYCTGIVWGLKQKPDGTWQQKQLFENLGQITSFGQDEAGEVYLVDQAGHYLSINQTIKIK